LSTNFIVAKLILKTKKYFELKKKTCKKKNFLNQKKKKSHKKKSSPEICEKMKKNMLIEEAMDFGLKKNFNIFFFFFNSKYPNLLKKSRTTIKFIDKVL